MLATLWFILIPNISLTQPSRYYMGSPLTSSRKGYVTDMLGIC